MRFKTKEIMNSILIIQACEQKSAFPMHNRKGEAVGEEVNSARDISRIYLATKLEKIHRSQDEKTTTPKV